MLTMMRTQTCNLLMKVKFLYLLVLLAVVSLIRKWHTCPLRTHSAKLVRDSLSRNPTNQRPSYSAASSIFHLDFPSKQNLSQLPWTSQQALFNHEVFKSSVFWDRACIPQALCLMRYPHSAPGFVLMVMPHHTQRERWNIVPNLEFPSTMSPAEIPTFLLFLTELQISFLVKHRHMVSAWTKL